MNEFITRCKSLNVDVIGPLLVAKIDEEDWKVNIKALVVMEAMAKNADCAPYADYFYENKEAIEDHWVTPSKRVFGPGAERL